MKAIVYEKYGSPDVLKLKEIDKPTPKDDEVLVKVCASSVNSFDQRFMRATPFFVRFMRGFLRPKQNILGADMAGTVEAVGKDVTRFKPGDEVYGDLSDDGIGCFAQYICVPQDGTIVVKPKNMTHEQAAAVPVAGVTALQGLRDKGGIREGMKVLVNGASGGVGTFAVLIAKAFGAQVTGVCSSKKAEYIKSIGADEVIAYDKEDFKQCGEKFDLIFDLVVNCDIEDYKRLLKPGGTCVIAGFSSILHMAKSAMRAKKETKRGQFTIMHMGSALADKQALEDLKELMESGKMTPAVQKVYPLAQTAAALRYFEDEHASGKLVIQIG